MRTFSHHEKDIIRKIISIEKGKIISINTFLEEFFFTEAAGRALIIQAKDRYAVFFIKTEIFDDPILKTEDMEKFLDILSLIAYLRNHGYISLFRGTKYREQSMFFLQDGFISAKPSKGKIILNTQGDYTSSPSTIHDKNGEVIYNGIIIEGEDYEMILSCTTGRMLINTQIKQLLASDSISGKMNKECAKIPTEKTIHTSLKPEKPLIKKKLESPSQPAFPKRKGINAALWLSILCLIWMAALTAFAYHQYTRYYPILTGLQKNHEMLRQEVASLSLKTRYYDSMFLSQRHVRSQKSYYYGIDISKWNGDELSLLRDKDSISFIILKATEGLNYTDARFEKNWTLAHSKDFILGAYHFYRTNDDPVKQAKHFWKTISSKSKTDIAPIVDIEQQSIPKNERTDPHSLQIGLLAFLDYLEKKCHRKPIIYTNVAFADKYLLNDSLSRYPLWLAEYTSATQPRLPKTWQEKGYKIWQKRDNYFIDSKVTDFDVYFGELAGLIE